MHDSNTDALEIIAFWEGGVVIFLLQVLNIKLFCNKIGNIGSG